MKTLVTSFLAVMLVFSGLMAQEVQWAHKVNEYSSQYTFNGLSNPYYSNQQVLRKPNVLPQGGMHPGAWMPANPEQKQEIKVSFYNPQRVAQIAIAESYNASAVKEVYVYDFQDVPYLVYTQEPSFVAANGRMLNVFIDKTAFDVYAVRLVLDGSALGDYYGIDGIGISEDTEPITASILLADKLNPNFEAKRVSENINSPFRETAPVFSPDGNTLYFSRAEHPENTGGIDDPMDIWYSTYNPSTGEWSVAQNIGSPLNTAGANYMTIVKANRDEYVAVLGNTYKKDGSMRTGVSVTSRLASQGEDSWEQPAAFRITEDYNFSENADFTLSDNRRVLIYSAQRNEGKGDNDLWVSFLQENGNFSRPLNLGQTVNTACAETSPFLAPDMKTLYFASCGFAGYGGMDLYMTKRLDDTWTNWTTPVNLGPLVNSSEDEMYLTMAPNGDIFFSRGDRNGDMDILRATTPLFKEPAHEVRIIGKVYDNENKNPLKGKITYYDDKNNLVASTPTNESGYYQLFLDAEKVYTYKMEIDCYENYSAALDLNIPKDSTLALVDLYLEPIYLESTQDLAVFFDLDKAVLRMEESNQQLDLLYNFLRNNPGVSIDIGGHTCTIGAENYNLKLSADRAAAVKNEMIRRGIDSFRINTAGFGFSQPRASNDTEAGREQNRRVEFTIRENTRCN
jgi:outer membrane protein OmpA-like peptidoglycan-associated protein